MKSTSPVVFPLKGGFEYLLYSNVSHFTGDSVGEASVSLIESGVNQNLSAANLRLFKA